MIKRSEFFRPFQLETTGKGNLVFRPSNYRWKSLAPFYSQLNIAVGNMLAKGKLPANVKFITLDYDPDDATLVLMESGNPVEFAGDWVAEHCSMTNTAAYLPIWETIAALWKMPIDVFTTLQKLKADPSEKEVVKNLPENMVEQFSYDGDLLLQEIFNEKAEEGPFHGMIETVTDPYFYGVRTVPREYFTKDEFLYFWCGPQDTIVLDPTKEIAGLLGMAHSEEQFEAALTDLVTVWNRSVDKARFVYDGVKWFGKALDYNLKQYAAGEIATIRSWVESGDLEFLLQANVRKQSNDVGVIVLQIIQQQNRKDIKGSTATPNIPRYKESYALQLGSVERACKKIQHLEWIKTKNLTSLFT